MLLGAPSPAAASSFDPLSYGDPHHAFWAEDSLWTRPADGAEVASWRNAGTQGIDAAQSNELFRPTFAESGVGGRPGIVFNGTGDRLVAPNITEVAQPGTAVMIAEWSNLIGDRRFFDSGTAGQRWMGRSANNLRIFAAVEIGGPDPTFGPHCFVGLFDGANSAIRWDGAEVASGNAGTYTQGGNLYIGCRNNQEGFFAGTISLLAFWPSDITTEAWFPELEQRLMAHYGIAS